MNKLSNTEIEVKKLLLIKHKKGEGGGGGGVVEFFLDATYICLIKN